MSQFNSPRGQLPVVRPRSRLEELGVWWRELDKLLVGLIAALAGFGIAAVAVASPSAAADLSTSQTTLDPLHFLYIHLRWLVVGFAAMFFVSMRSRREVRRGALLAAAGFTVLLLLVPVAGYEVNGAQRWIRLGTGVQPAEFLKPAFAVALAWVLSWRLKDPGIPVVGLSVAYFALIAMLLMMQPDFGSTVLFGGVLGVLILVSGVPFQRFAIFFGAALGALALVLLLYENGRNRILSFFSGGTEFDQVDLAARTLRAGGWLGTGPFMGERKMSLPEAHTDYIFSVIGEEFGLVTCGIIIVVYLALVIRVLSRIADEEDLFTVLASTGLIALVGGQAFINILVNLQLFPSKGMTLPLISYGGSSTIALCLALGMLLALTRRNPYLSREGPIWAERGDDD
jgi:cell division protein FtsW